jgi:hypothetical protein
MAAEVNVQVTYLSGRRRYVYLYVRAAYLKDGEPSIAVAKGRPRSSCKAAARQIRPAMTNVAPPAKRDRAPAMEEVTS